MFEKILVAADGSEPARRAAEAAAELAHRCGAELHAVHVVHAVKPSEEFLRFAEIEHIGPKPEFLTLVMPPGPERTGRPFPAIAVTRAMMEAMAEPALRAARDAARAKGITKLKEDVLSGDPAAALLAYAQSQGVDLIVAGRRGLGALGSLALGSVTLKLCHHAQCPVLTVP